MHANRDTDRRGATHRAHGEPDGAAQLDARRRRDEMHAAEGHSGSVPRGNQQTEREILGSHRIEWDRVLGH